MGQLLELLQKENDEAVSTGDRGTVLLFDNFFGGVHHPNLHLVRIFLPRFRIKSSGEFISLTQCQDIGLCLAPLLEIGTAQPQDRQVDETVAALYGNTRPGSISGGLDSDELETVRQWIYTRFLHTLGSPLGSELQLRERRSLAEIAFALSLLILRPQDIQLLPDPRVGLDNVDGSQQ